jgi:bifunctional non-homologous end joining protein LigD
VLLPWLADRPIILVRYPDGIRGKSFYQWNAPPGKPDWVRTLEIRHADDEDRRVEVFLVDSIESLSYLANLACIPIHILASRAETIDFADFLTIDFDVKHASLAEAVEQAHTLRELVESVGLEGYPKTSGQTGLHVLVPLGPGVGFAVARGLADVLGRLLCHRHPRTATMERVVKKRGPRVYVDTGQTGTSRSIVAPWSVRATAGARVSTPLSWDEVTVGLDPGAFTLRTVVARASAAADPMAGLLTARPDLPRAVTKLETLAQRMGVR